MRSIRLERKHKQEEAERTQRVAEIVRSSRAQRHQYGTMTDGLVPPCSLVQMAGSEEERTRAMMREAKRKKKVHCCLL